MRYALVLAALLLPRSLAAQDPKWDISTGGFYSSGTCLFWSEEEYCAGIGANHDGDMESGFQTLWSDGPLEPVAWGFYVPINQAWPYISESAGTGVWSAPWAYDYNGPLPAALAGKYYLLAALDMRDPFARFNYCYSCDPETAPLYPPRFWFTDFGSLGMPFVQEGDYIYGLPAGMVSAWWAEAEDGSALVGCFQRPGGPLYQTEGWQECDVVVTPTPEPATLLLLATGLLTLGLLARRKRVTG